MEKNYSQLELFTPKNQPGQEGEGTKKIFNFSFQIRNYEKAILSVILLIVTGVICFSLGVEHGKKISSRRQDYIDLAKTHPVKQLSTMSPGPQPAQAAAIPKNTPVRQEQSVPRQNQENYTIQVASFQDKRTAEKAATSLKKKGMVSLLMPKGKYIVLCVGKFENKKSAQSTLSELKKTYRDCFIRRM